MSIGKIAVGVFLGNLAFGALAWIVLSVTMNSAATRAAIAQTDADYRAMQNHQH